MASSSSRSRLAEVREGDEAEIWVDGKMIGIADDFDGFPNLLWLEKGTYDVVIYLQGYATLSRQYTVYPGLIIDVEDLLRSVEKLLSTGRLERIERGARGGRAMVRKRILVVDDSLTVRELQRKLLGNQGYDVAVAVDGIEALP